MDWSDVFRLLEAGLTGWVVWRVAVLNASASKTRSATEQMAITVLGAESAARAAAVSAAKVARETAAIHTAVNGNHEKMEQRLDAKTRRIEELILEKGVSIGEASSPATKEP